MFVETKAPGETPVKQNPSLEGFVAWLETKDPNEAYNYLAPHVCACGQYSLFLGEFWIPSNAGPKQIDRVYRDLNVLSAGGPWTFGALLARARRAAYVKAECLKMPSRPRYRNRS